MKIKTPTIEVDYFPNYHEVRFCNCPGKELRFNSDFLSIYGEPESIVKDLRKIADWLERESLKFQKGLRFEIYATQGQGSVFVKKVKTLSEAEIYIRRHKGEASFSIKSPKGLVAAK